MNSRSIAVSTKTRNLSFLPSLHPSLPLPLSFSFSLSLPFRRYEVSIILYSREKADVVLAEVSIGSAKGSTLGKAPLITAPPYDIARPVAWISLFSSCSPSAITSRVCTYVHLILFLFLSTFCTSVFIAHERLIVPPVLSRALDHFASVHLRQWASFFPPSGRFPRSISSLTNDGDSNPKNPPLFLFLSRFPLLFSWLMAFIRDTTRDTTLN